MTAVPQPLTDLRAGQKATVADIKLPPDDRGRLLELGLVPGTPVELVRFALLDDPVEIKVRGYKLSLPRQEARQVLVQPVAGAE
jgi:ferrous iron transport protein A